jgi:PAS domain S-box-containing protein
MRMILDSSDEPTVFIDPDRTILWANRAYYTSLSAEPADVIGRHCYEVVWGRTAPCGGCRIPAVLSSGHSVSSEAPYSAGRTYWITTYPVKDDGGALMGYIEKVADITAVKEAQEGIRREKEKYNLLFQSANDMIYLHEMTGDGTPGRILDVNDAACRRMGYTRGEFLAMNVADINDPALDDSMGSLVSGIGNEDRSVFEWRHLTRAGESVPVEISVNRFLLDGAAVGLSIVRDITERKEAEGALRRREHEYRTLVENINEVIFRFDLNGDIVYVSPAIRRLVGVSSLSPEALVGRNFLEFIHPDDRARLEEHFRGRLSGATKQATFRLLTGMGGERWVLESSQPIYEGDCVVGIQGVFLDITNMKMMDAALKKANKKLNILSSITRHDILNQITSMNLYLDIIRGDSDDPQRREEFFDAAEVIMANLERIITFTRDYEDLGVREPEWQDVGAVIDREVGAFAGAIAVHNTVQGLEVYADSMLGKVFSNLIGNSLMHGGTVHGVALSFAECGSEGCIIVADDGVGVPRDMKEKIFSKGVGKNTGFGLFLSREILDITGITIRETGVPGAGARFELRVPKDKFHRLSDA